VYSVAKSAARHAEIFSEALDVLGLEQNAPFTVLVRTAFTAIGLTLEAEPAPNPGELVFGAMSSIGHFFLHSRQVGSFAAVVTFFRARLAWYCNKKRVGIQ